MEHDNTCSLLNQYGRGGNPCDCSIKRRLQYLQEQIENECISYGEIAELQSLAQYIEPNNAVLLEWAGVEERTPENIEKWVKNGEHDKLKEEDYIKK
jgi:hypothetical protein